MRSISVKLAGSKLPRDTRITAVPGIEVVNLMPPGCSFNYVAIDYRNVNSTGGKSRDPAAAAAGTTGPGLRRRYQTKLQLATAVIDSLRVQPLPTPSGAPRTDAAEIVTNFQVNVLRLHGMATGGTILAEERRNPELLAHFRQHLVEPRRAALHRTLAAGVKTGELPAALDLDATVNLLIGSFYACYLRTGTVPRGWVERVLLGIWPPQVSSGRPAGQLPKSAGR